MSRRKIDLAQISDRDIIKSFYLSQGLLLVICIVAYLYFYEDMPAVADWITGQPLEILLFGFGSGMILAFIELIIDKLVPKAWFDDDGINQRIFQALTPVHILFAMLVVAFIEEGLFRGVIQTELGLIIASLLFGFIHVRYLKKPLMLIVALGMGFYLGWIYMETNSLLVPIAAHFTIDVILGFIIKRRGAR